MTWTFPAIGVLVILALLTMLFRYREEPPKAGAAQRKDTGVA
jgi:hypothetical protein